MCEIVACLHAKLLSDKNTKVKKKRQQLKTMNASTIFGAVWGQIVSNRLKKITLELLVFKKLTFKINLNLILF